jgi:hypothetical protein
MTTSITKKKITFCNDNEVRGWFKTTDGTKTNFLIDNNGEVKQWSKSTTITETNPFILGLLEMLYCSE